MGHEDGYRDIAIPVSRIAEPEILEQMETADVIWGCDTSSDNMMLFYG